MKKINWITVTDQELDLYREELLKLPEDDLGKHIFQIVDEEYVGEDLKFPEGYDGSADMKKTWGVNSCEEMAIRDKRIEDFLTHKEFKVIQEKMLMRLIEKIKNKWINPVKLEKGLD